MSKFLSISVLCAAMLAVSATATAKPAGGAKKAAEPIYKGETLELTQLEYVRIVNLKSLSRGSRIFFYGDGCAVREGFRVSVVGIDGERVLLRYDQDRKRVAMDCINGTLFFLKKDRYLFMRKERARRDEQERHEKAVVRKLLKEEYDD